MRKDIESNFAYSSIIATAKKIVEDEGKDFDKEFKKWKNQKKGR